MVKCGIEVGNRVGLLLISSDYYHRTVSMKGGKRVWEWVKLKEPFSFRFFFLGVEKKEEEKGGI